MFRMFCSVSWSVPSSIQTFVHITKVHSFFYFFVHLFLRSHIRSSIRSLIHPSAYILNRVLFYIGRCLECVVLWSIPMSIQFVQYFILVYLFTPSAIYPIVHPNGSLFVLHQFSRISLSKSLVHQFICSFVYLLFIPPPVFSSVRKYLSISSIHSSLRPFVHPICSSIRLNNRFVRFLDGCQGRHSNLYNHMKSVWKHYI